TVMTFLIVPILVIENKNPIAALQESVTLLKKTWGEQLVSNLSFGVIFVLLSLPAVGLVLLGVMAGHPAVIVACVGVAIIYWILLSLIHTALQTIFQTALYLYARDGVVPQGFHADVLGTAIG
ncbi:MAG: DUF6159 family protein, partial [Limisphaerales bacterium]